MSHRVGDVARLTGVTVRTLHHYDAVGLVTPSSRNHSGYRSYSPADLERLQRVLFYRELGFGLDEIKAVLADNGDPDEHLRRQHRLVNDRIERLTRIAGTLRRTMEARKMGINLTPDELFEVFGETDPAEHHDEAEQRWGGTEAWRESQRRTAAYGKEDWVAIKSEGDAIENSLAELKRAGTAPNTRTAMDAVEAHRLHISRWFYDCPVSMHRCLGDMYVADERFTAHYDSREPGLAQWLRDAIHANADRQQQ